MLADPAVLYARPAQRRCMDICEEIVEVIRGEPETPVRTGELLSGYRAVRDGAGAAVINPVDYWHFVEFGTEYMKAEPHVRPAIETVRARHLS